MTEEWKYESDPGLKGVAPDPVLAPPFGTADRLGGAMVVYILMLLGMIIVGGLAQFFLGFEANAILSEVLVILVPVFVLLRGRDPAGQLGLRIWPQLGQVVWSFLGILALAVLIAELTYWSDLVFPMPDAIKNAYLDAVTADTLPELLALVLAAAVAPGLCEEVAFRGFFQPMLRSRYGKHVGIALAAGLFAVMHLDPWHLLALFIIGLFLGYLYAWTGTLWVPVLAHFMNNATSVLLIYLAPDTSLSQMHEPPPRWLVPVSFVALVAAIRWFLHQARVEKDDRGVDPTRTDGPHNRW
jgi:membrane protease YdiL (CAAX protease family)